ncbi:MAG: UDP-glucose/GDP-mannose dehydrogenase family protein, partial [Phycisphaerales bacterium]|nr:UDP-glucose/GDP-mannose dehydrogenase family protein [Phycisphaerales bacterium]
MPGSTQGPIRQTLERTSGRVVGQNLGLCYSPEFVAIGSVIRDFLRPDMLLIGQSDDYAGDLLEAIGRQAALTQPDVARMNFVNAELAKIAVNTFVTTKITFANMLGSVCQNLPGADVDVVTQAIGLDSRIGRKYLKAAVGYGGPCFPRDNIALATLAKNTGGHSDLAQAVDTANRQHVSQLADLVCGHVQTLLPGGGATIAVLGLAYKPDTDVIDESQGIALVKELHWRGLPVIAHDPAAGPNARKLLPPTVPVIDSLT